MSEEPHPFTTIDQQIQLLEDRKLIFRSKEYAKQILSMYGYYNVINGYKDNYVISVDGEEQYKEGVTFEQIVSLFSMDHSIRNEVMSIMLNVYTHTLQNQSEKQTKVMIDLFDRMID